MIGGVAEWLKAAVSKTVSRFAGTQVRILPPPPVMIEVSPASAGPPEAEKPLCRKVPRVRIPASPPS